MNLKLFELLLVTLILLFYQTHLFTQIAIEVEGDVQVSGHVSTLNPIDSQHVATKSYVDSLRERVLLLKGD